MMGWPVALTDCNKGFVVFKGVLVLVRFSETHLYYLNLMKKRKKLFNTKKERGEGGRKGRRKGGFVTGAQDSRDGSVHFKADGSWFLVGLVPSVSPNTLVLLRTFIVTLHLYSNYLKHQV